MSLIEQLIQNVERKVNDKRYYYSRNRENQFATDCSWLIITSIQECGIQTNATYTGDMVKCLKATGKFEILPFSPNAMTRGDILLKHISGSNGHTVLYIGGGEILEACNKKNGLRRTQYYPNNYQYIIRPHDFNSEVLNFRMIRKGDKCIEVGMWQLFLNKYYNTRLVIDCDFGTKTHDATITAQYKMGFTGSDVDGIVGVKTWTKIYSIMVTGC